tara:strand:- start:150 stop:983 length:834 start_codon:yes stop_codon:yes gene_type:complete
MFFILYLSIILGCYCYPLQKLSNSRIVLLPGYGCCKGDYGEFVTNCNKYNIQVDVVNIERWEWLKIMKNLFNANYWNYKCTPQEMFDWYLQKSKKTLMSSYQQNNNQPVIVCGHSAGGWLGRALLNDGILYDTTIKTNTHVSALITMGTPNIPPLNITTDTTRGCLTYVNNMLPGSFLQSRNIQYMTLGSNVKKISMVDSQLSFKDNMIKQSYLSLTGDTQEEHVYGDGVVPIKNSHLHNAIQMNFDDVYHFKRKDKKYYWEESVMSIWLYELEKRI